MSEEDQAKNPPEPTSSERNAPSDNAGTIAPPISPYPRRHPHKRWIILAALVVLVIAGAFLWHYLSGFESTDDAQVDVHLYPVSARISGYIQAVNVGDNQWVDQGSALVEIDPSDYRVSLAKAEASLASQRRRRKVRISMCRYLPSIPRANWSLPRQILRTRKPQSRRQKSRPLPPTTGLWKRKPKM